MSELRKPDFSVFKARVAPYDFLLIHAIPGAEVHFSESGEDIVLQRLFAGRRNGFFVDIGAFRPIRYSNTYIFKALYGWRGINVDLSKQAIKEFDSRRPTDINVRAAVGKPGTRRTIWYFSEPALNTMSPANLRRQSVRGIEPVSVDTVEVVALAELLDRYMPSGTNIDLLNIDVEGLDLEVLQTNDWKKYRPKVVAIEDYDLLPKAQSVIYEYLTDQGYALFSHVFDTSLYIQRGLRTAPKERRAAAIPAVERLQEAVPGIEERTYVLARSHPRMRLDEGDGCDSRSAGAGQSHSAGVMAEKGGR